MAVEIKNKYYEGIGRRKTSIARVRIFESKNLEFTVNGKEFTSFFPGEVDKKDIFGPLSIVGVAEKFSVTVKASGGGLTGWRDAIKLGLARALIKYNAELKPELRKAGYVTRDARAVERKKAGLKKARKAPRFSKR